MSRRAAQSPPTSRPNRWRRARWIVSCSSRSGGRQLSQTSPGCRPPTAPANSTGHPPSAAPTTASAASQHGPSRTSRDRRGRSRCPSSPASRASRACSPAIRSAISARRPAIIRGQLRSRVAAVPGMAPAGDPGRIVEREIEAAKVDDQAQVLDIGRAVFAVRVVSPTGSRKPPRALVEAHRVGRDADRRLPVRRSACGQETLEWLRCQAILTADRPSDGRAFEPRP